MKKGLIALIVIGAVTLTAGSAMFGLAFAKGAFSNNSWSKEETNTYTPEGSFNKIDVDIVTADLTFKPAEGNKTKVVCVEKEKIHHTAEISNDTLVIREKDERKFYEKWFGFVSRMKVTVYLPETTYEELKIEVTTGSIVSEDSFNFMKVNVKSTTGDLKLANVTGKSADIKITTGNVTLNNYNMYGELNVDTTSGDYAFNNVQCDSATLHTTTGKYNLNDFIVTGGLNTDRPNLDISGTSSDVTFKNCDAHYIKVKTTTGDIKGNLLTKKKFDAQTTTGTSLVDNDRTADDICYIRTTTGDIDISVGAK